MDRNNYLTHYGVKGMKWGHRKQQSLYVANRQARDKTVEKSRSNTPEAEAARKEKVKKAAKVGAAVAGTALAIYGAHKLNQYVKTKNGQIAAQMGYQQAESIFKANEGFHRSMAETGMFKGHVETSGAAANARKWANNASYNKFSTAAKNVVDYNLSGGKLKNLKRVEDYYDFYDSKWRY